MAHGTDAAGWAESRRRLVKRRIVASTAGARPVVALALGALTDRCGGRRVFSLLLLARLAPLAPLGFTRSYGALLAVSVFLGLGGASFSVGVPLVSRWYPPQRQGLALGIYGMGNIGTALAGLLVPRAAAALGWPRAYWLLLPVVAAMAAAFALLGRDAPRPPGQRAPGIAAAVREPRAWLLSFWYFITFGGFVAFGGYLPKLYVDLFRFPKAQAGAAAAAFVLTATLARPLGGALADRLGGTRATAWALAGIAALAALLTLALPLAGFRLTILALGVCFGLGNGAIFKLVPQFFPRQTGAVTGLVGALGGLGGFFPPLVMGALRDRLGTYTPAFAGLAATAAAGWLLVGTLRPRPAPWHRPRQEAALLQLEEAFASRAARNAFLVAAALVLLIYAGSSRLTHFDPALYGYAVATLVAAVGLTIRLTAWLMRPATRTLARRLGQLLWRRVVRRPGVANPVPAGLGRWYEGRVHPGFVLAAQVRGGAAGAAPLAATPHGDPGLEPEARPTPVPGRPGPAAALRTMVQAILLGRFLFRRGLWRGLQHFLLMWGVLGSFAITLPLTFGWLHFEAAGEGAYTVVAFGARLFTMPVAGALAGLFYHALSAFAVLTLAGTVLALIRRLLHREARVDQRVEYDLFPLYLILAVTLSGLALTVSHNAFAGAGYPFLALLHQITVVLLLLYLPFGKLFHIPMRGLAVGSEVYHEVGAHLGLQACARCRKVFATALQVQDVIGVLREAGQRLLAPDGRTHLAEYCPECRRVLRGLVYTRRELRPGERGAARPLFPHAPPAAPTSDTARRVTP